MSFSFTSYSCNSLFLFFQYCWNSILSYIYFSFYYYAISSLTLWLYAIALFNLERYSFFLYSTSSAFISASYIFLFSSFSCSSSLTFNLAVYASINFYRSNYLSNILFSPFNFLISSILSFFLAYSSIFFSSSFSFSISNFFYFKTS